MTTTTAPALVQFECRTCAANLLCMDNHAIGAPPGSIVCCHKGHLMQVTERQP